MRRKDGQDWVDRVMRGDVWEPPHDFTNRVVRRAVTVLPQAPPRLGMVARLQSVATGAVQSMRGRIEGTAWVLLQYRQLFGRF